LADVVTSQLVENGNNWWVYVLTNLSDGTGETNVVKVDGSPSGPLGVNLIGQTLYPGVHLKIREVEYSVQNMGVKLTWDASPTPANCLLLEGYGKFNFDKVGGLVIPPTLVGATGKILLSTVLPQVSSQYTLKIRGTKGIHQ
jgi:hypothetical protein